MSQATEQAATPRLSGREAAIARRQALATHGKAALKGTSPAQPAAPAPQAQTPAPSQADVSSTVVSTPAESAAAVQGHTCSCQHNSTRTEASTPIPPAPVPASRQRRIEQSLKGRGNAPAARPTGRVRPAPPKVEVGTTLSGSEVTGTQVERTTRVTGNEPGTCRTVTGTEYIGTEQYSKFCGTSPTPNAAKVGVSTTSHGRSVTGTEVGRIAKVTGDESGTCKRVTGTEYLSAEESSAFCGTRLEPSAEKVTVGRTAGSNLFTGGDADRSSRVTGGDAGAGSRVTGGNYANPGIRREQGDSLKKPQASHPSVGSAVRGTLPVLPPSRTAAEASASSRVTGSRYLTDDPFISTQRAQPFMPPAMAARMLRESQVTGMVMAMPSKLTGDEYHASKPVTGTSSIAVEHLVSRPAGASTGRTLGEAIYVHPRATSPDAAADLGHNRLMDEPQAQLPSGSGAFSMTSPTMAAGQRNQARITGSAYGGGSGRISGSMARAVGLVSGTPEFRYRDDSQPVARIEAPVEQPSTERITGEGRERTITGDAWDRGDRVTGTEGQSATRRNPTLRGMPPVVRQTRQTEKPEAAEIRITGGSGPATKGATVTLSGGARG